MSCYQQKRWYCCTAKCSASPESEVGHIDIATELQDYLFLCH